MLNLLDISSYLKFEDTTFYNLTVYHYDLHDKQIYIIIGWAENLKEHYVRIQNSY